MKKNIEQLLVTIENQKSILAKDRDRLSESYDELNDIINSMESAEMDIVYGLTLIRNGLDHASKFV